MNILAIDTSTEACSCALWQDGACREFFELAPRRHGELILGMADQLLADAGIRAKQLHALAFGRGPGAFTGVRIAAGVVQGIAYAISRPVAPVSSLQAMAQGVGRELGHDSVLAAFDARMNEVYWGAYRRSMNGVLEPLMDERVVAPERVPVPSQGDWFGAGTGWESHRDSLTRATGARLIGIESNRYPRARDVATLGAAAVERGEVVAAEQALPVYLRDKVV